MYKYNLSIDGMGCSMCEMHVEEVLKENISADKIKASSKKNNVLIFTNEELTLEDFKKILDPTGYRLTSFNKEEAIKGLFGYK